MEVRFPTCFSFNENTYTQLAEWRSIRGWLARFGFKQPQQLGRELHRHQMEHTAHSISIFSDTSVMKNGTFFLFHTVMPKFSFFFLLNFLFFCSLLVTLLFFSLLWPLIAHRKRCNNQNGICGANRRQLMQQRRAVVLSSVRQRLQHPRAPSLGSRNRKNPGACGTPWGGRCAC